MSAGVAIVGGGISGLAAAYYLSRAGLACTLLDPAPRLGGVIRTESIDGCVVEAGPDSFISQKPWARELIRDLGLAGEVIASNDHLRKTYILRRGRLIPMPDGLFLMVPTEIRPLLSTPLLGWPTKLKMAMDLLRRPPAGQPDRSVAEFITDHYGPEAVDYLAEPLLAGIYGGDPAELSMASVLPRFVEIERRYGSLTRGVLAARREQQAAGSSKPEPLFLTLKGGMQQLIDALQREIAGRVSVIRAAVESVEALSDSGGYRLRCAGQSLEAGHVILATPAHAAATLVRALDATLADQLAAIPYHSSITVALGYDRATFRHPLNGFGFLVPRVERNLVTACTWVGAKFPNRVADNRVLLRVFIGAGRNEAPLARSNESLVAAACCELRLLMGVTAEPLFARVARWPRAMAQYTVGHQRRVDEISARLAGHPGLYVIGNAYIGIGIPDCVRTAQIAGGRITGALPAASPLAAAEIPSRP